VRRNKTLQSFNKPSGQIILIQGIQPCLRNNN
jgi:hypothetical protein